MSLVQKKYLNYLDNKEGAKKYNEFKDILYGNPDSLVLELFKIISCYLKKKERVKILDVGGGDGKRLKHLMDLFEEGAIDTESTLVEPSRSFVSNLRKSLKDKKYKIKISNSKFEDFSPDKKYDLILFMHSIYTFKDGGYVKKAKKMLGPGGALVFVVNDKKSFLGDLKKVTDKKFNSNRREADALEKDLRKNDCKIKMIKFDTKFGGLVNKDGFTKKGRLVMEWISLVPYDQIDEKTKKDALEVISKHTKSGKVREKEVVIIIK